LVTDDNGNMKSLSFLMILVICICCNQTQQKGVDSPVPYDKKPTVTKPKLHPTTASCIKQKRFDRPIEFLEFRVDTFRGKKTPINYKSHLLARQFRTIITDTYKNAGLNFAGHYSIVTWGCGTNCEYGAIVDLQTGIVYAIPTASGGYGYKKNSRLLVVNPPDSSGFYDDCIYCLPPELWVWVDRQKKFKRLD
jgi:hypothetical protein